MTPLFFSCYLPKGNKNICFPKRLACQYSELLCSQLANRHKHPKCPPRQWINTVAPSYNTAPSAIKISTSLINNVHESQKHHISRRSRTQTNIHFMTPFICGVRKGNSDLRIVRTVLPMGGGVWSEESMRELPRWQPFFYILMEVAVTGVSALIKTRSCALKFYAFTCRSIWPQ